MNFTRRTFASGAAVVGAIPATALAQTPVASPGANAGARTVFHLARITANVPAELEPLYPNQDFYIHGLGDYLLAYPTAGSSLEDVLADTAEAAGGDSTDAIDIDLNGVPGKLLESVRGIAVQLPAAVVIAPYPEPFSWLGNEMTHLVIELSPKYLDEFLPSVSLDVSDVTPEEYLTSVLDLAQRNSVVTDEVDWDALRAEAENATTDMDAVHAFFDTHLRPELEDAGDIHSRFLPPEGVESVDATPGATPESDPMPESVVLDDGTLLLSLPTTSSDDYAGYVQLAQNALSDVDSSGECHGVIVDLRNNFGGNIYVMTGALSPLLPESDIYGYSFPGADAPNMWTKESALAYLETNMGISVSDFDLTHLPVAILFGPGTASSAELTAISFIGRENSQSFGMESGGYTTGNNQYGLLDGWSMNLATSLMMDREGQEYGGTLLPDSEVEYTDDQIGTDDDPVIAAAQDWLSQQPCQLPGATPEATPVD